jgi:hypothetical protein
VSNYNSSGLDTQVTKSALLQTTVLVVAAFSLNNWLFVKLSLIGLALAGLGGGLASQFMKKKPVDDE